MRALALSIAGLGGLLVLVAGFMAFERYADNGGRALVQQEITQTVDALTDADQGTSRRKRGLAGLAKTARDLSSGVFRTSPIALKTAMPPAPEGWEKTAFDLAQTEWLTSFDYEPSPLYEGELHAMISDFVKTDKRKSLGAVATYTKGVRMVQMRAYAELDSFRTLATGSALERKALLAENPGGPKLVLATLDGHPLRLHPQKMRLTSSFEEEPVDFRRLSLTVGHVYEFEIITNASDADIATVVQGLDIAALQDVLPEPTLGYRLGTGFAYKLGGTPGPDAGVTGAAAVEVANLAIQASRSDINLNDLSDLSSASGAAQVNAKAADEAATTPQPVAKRNTCRQENGRKICRFE
ncbi:MAG: hypothetical protein AAGD04_04805 [Pseudomonadota bacterium]